MRCCFTSYVYGVYQDYIPIFIYSVARAFPQHVTKIFLKEKLSDKNKESLESVRKFCDNFEVIENFSDLDHCELPHGAANRYLLTREYFDGCEYIYICDIDFIIYNKYNNNFIDTYIDGCKENNLPFYNHWNYDGRFRMGGVHFIIKDEYFDILDDYIEEMKNPNCRFRAKYTDNTMQSFDEEMLYYMLFKAFRIGHLEEVNKTFNGMHLKAFRSTKRNDHNSSFVDAEMIDRWDKGKRKINIDVIKEIFTDDFIKICMRADDKLNIHKLLCAVNAIFI